MLVSAEIPVYLDNTVIHCKSTLVALNYRLATRSHVKSTCWHMQNEIFNLKYSLNYSALA